MKISLMYLAVFFLLCFGDVNAQNKTSIFPAEKFVVVSGKTGAGKAMVGSFNAGYKNYGLKSQYSWCLTINIGLDLKHVTANGLPVKTESDIANKLEDDLLRDIKKLATVHYIGHVYNDTFLDIYAYIDDPEKVNAYLQSQVNKKGLVRGFAFKIKQDPGWSTVAPFLK